MTRRAIWIESGPVIAETARSSRRMREHAALTRAALAASHSCLRRGQVVLGRTQARLGRAGVLGGRHQGDLSEVLGRLEQELPVAVWVLCCLRDAAAVDCWDDLPPMHTLDQIQAAIRDMQLALGRGDYATALSHLRVCSALLGVPADRAASE